MERKRIALVISALLILASMLVMPALSASSSSLAAPSRSQFTASQAAVPTPVLQNTISLNALHGWSPEVGNHLKTFDVAVDEARNLVYAQGILTSGIAVIDGRTDTLIGSVDSGIGDVFHLTHLAVHPTDGTLYIANYSDRTLRRVDPVTRSVTGPVSLAAAPSAILVDATTNRVYVSLQDAGKLAVHDATTLAPIAVIDLTPAKPLGMALDSTTHRLYVVDSRAPGASMVSRLNVIDTDTLTPASVLSFSNTMGAFATYVDRDPADGRLFVTTPENLFILSASGAVQHVTKVPDNARQPLYLASTGEVYLVSKAGISDVQSSLSAVDATTGNLERTVDLDTGGAQRLALNRTTGKLYTVGTEYDEVVVVDANSYAVTKHIDVGNSVEDIAVAPSDGTIYLANRLGGSTVIAYSPATGAWNELQTGGWPTAADVDPTLNRLYVLSHFQGTLSAFSLSSDTLAPTLLGTTQLGLTDTTDALSRQTVDTVRHRIITTHPEHDAVVIVDGNSLAVTTTINDLPSFVYDKDKTSGAGVLQPVLDPGLNKLYVLAFDARKVDVFDGNAGYAYVRTVDLTGQQWSWTTQFRDNVTWIDSDHHRLYVGPFVVDTFTDTYVGQLPSGTGQVVVGPDASGRFLYTIGAADNAKASASRRARSHEASSDMVHLYTLDRDSYAVQNDVELRPLPFAAPYKALDVDRSRFYIGYMQAAEVDIYDLGTGIVTPTPTSTATRTTTPAPSSTPSPTRRYHYLPYLWKGQKVTLSPTPTPISSLTPTPTATATPTRTATNTPTPPMATSTPAPGGHGISPEWGSEVQVSSAGGNGGGSVGRTLAIDSLGHLHAVWTEHSGNSYDVYYARSTDGVSWTAGRDIANSPFPAIGPNIAVGPDNALHVVWVDRRAGGAQRVYYSRSFDGGTTWEDPRDLSGDNTRDAQAPGISVDTRNRVHLTWHLGNPDPGQPATQVYYTRSTDGGGNFETPRRLNSANAHAAFARFSVDGTDGDLLAIAWRDNRRNPDWDVYIAVSTDGGESFTERIGQSSSNRDWDPDVFVDANGVIQLAYMTYRQSDITIDYKRSADQGQTWSPEVTLSEARSRFAFWAPDISHDVQWLLWKDERDADPPPGANMRADIAARYSTDGGQTWSALEFMTDLGDGDVRFPSPIVGSDGRAHVMWSDLRYGADHETIFLRSRPTAAGPTP